MNSNLPFLSYALLMAFTPGPNNIMAMSNASKYGFKKSMRFNFGVFTGSFAIMACCAFFTSLIYESIPQIEPAMRVAGAAYILFLAWNIWRDAPRRDGKRALETTSYLTGVSLQFVNVKMILIGVTSMSAFILPFYRGFWQVAPFVFLLAFFAFSGNCCWSMFGTIFEILFSKYRKSLNALLALLLVYCAYTQLTFFWKVF